MKSTIPLLLLLISFIIRGNSQSAQDYFTKAKEYSNTNLNLAHENFIKVLDFYEGDKRDSFYYNSCYALSVIYVVKVQPDSSAYYLDLVKNYALSLSPTSAFRVKYQMANVKYIGRFRECSEAIDSLNRFTSEQLYDDIISFDYYQTLGMNYQMCKDLDSAIVSFKKALDFNIDNNRRSMVLNTLGQISKKQDDFESSLFYLKEAMNLTNKESQSYKTALLTMGDLYFKLKDYPNSISTLEKLLSYSDITPDYKCIAFKTLGYNYMVSKDYNTAKEYLDSVSVLASNNKLLQTLHNNKHAIATLHLLQDEPEKALEIINEAKSEVDRANNIHNYILDLEVELQAMASSSNNKYFLEVLDNYIALVDSMVYVNSQSVLKEYKVQYETEKKEKEILLLQKDQEISIAQIQRKNSLLQGSGMGILGCGFGLFYLIAARRKEKELYDRDIETLERENKEWYEKVQRYRATKQKIAIRDDDVIKINGDGPIIPLVDLKYVQSQGNYVNIYVKGKEKPILLRYPLTKFLNEYLPQNIFAKVNNRTIVNMNYIVRKKALAIYIEENGAEKQFNVGRTFKENFQKLYDELPDA